MGSMTTATGSRIVMTATAPMSSAAQESGSSTTTFMTGGTTSRSRVWSKTIERQHVIWTTPDSGVYRFQVVDPSSAESDGSIAKGNCSQPPVVCDPDFGDPVELALIKGEVIYLTVNSSTYPGVSQRGAYTLRLDITKIPWTIL